MKKILIFICIIALISITALAGWKFYRSDSIEVVIVKPEVGPIESLIRVTGRVINDRTVTMTALVNGQIQGMLVQKGDKVKAGQVLAYLDKREADALVEKAAAVVAREQQAVEEASLKLKRLQEILIAGNASTQAVEDAQAFWRAAKARFHVAEAEHRVAQIHQEKVEIRAPWDGVIIEKSAEQGQWLEAGIKLFTLVAEAGREIEANVDAGDSGVVEIGQTVVLSCDAFPDKQWNETVHWISPAIITGENAVLNSFAVRTTLGKDAPPLLLGQQVDIEISTASNDSAIKLPYTALIESDGTTRVAIVEQDRVKYVPVTTGIEDFTYIEIIEGISASDLVINVQGKVPMEGRLVTAKQVPAFRD